MGILNLKRPQTINTCVEFASVFDDVGLVELHIVCLNSSNCVLTSPILMKPVSAPMQRRDISCYKESKCTVVITFMHTCMHACIYHRSCLVLTFMHIWLNKYITMLIHAYTHTYTLYCSLPVALL